MEAANVREPTRAPRATLIGVVACSRCSSLISTVVMPARRVLALEADVLDVLSVAVAFVGAIAIELQAGGARLDRLVHMTADGIEDVQIDVRRTVAPRDGELERTGAEAAAFVDHAVAVVVDGVEAKLRAGRRAHGRERDAVAGEMRRQTGGP